MSADPGTTRDLEGFARSLGERAGPAFLSVVEAAGGVEQGPQKLAEALGLDKVLTSRLLKALRNDDPIARLHHLPGPEPLRRLLRAAQRRVQASEEVIESALRVIEDFDELLTDGIGGRSALTSLLSAWSLEVRAEFELRRKQAAWRAWSELRGVSLDVSVSAVFLRPADVAGRLDVTWVIGLIGLRRLRPGVPVKATTRRFAAEDGERRPRDLDGHPLGGMIAGRLDEFCVSPPGRFSVHRSGDVHQYLLDGDTYGPHGAVDLLLAEVNEAEMAASVEPGSGRRGWVFSDTPVPTKKMVFDVFVHEDAYPGTDPELLLYDTASHGVANVNDPGRDLDQLHLAESIRPLGRGLDDIALKEFAPYPRLIDHVFQKLSWEGERFDVHRVEIDYPLHGMQVTVAFDAPEH